MSKGGRSVRERKILSKRLTEIRRQDMFHNFISFFSPQQRLRFGIRGGVSVQIPSLMKPKDSVVNFNLAFFM